MHSRAAPTLTECHRPLHGLIQRAIQPQFLEQGVQHGCLCTCMQGPGRRDMARAGSGGGGKAAAAGAE